MEKSKIRRQIEWLIKVSPILLAVIFAITNNWGTAQGDFDVSVLDNIADYMPQTITGDAFIQVAEYFTNDTANYYINSFGQIVGYWVLCDIIYLCYDMLVWLPRTLRGLFTNDKK